MTNKSKKCNECGLKIRCGNEENHKKGISHKRKLIKDKK